MTQSLRVELRPSPILIGALLIVHVLAIVSVALALSGWPLLPLVSGILISLSVCLAEALQRRADSALAVELRAEGQAAWKDRKGVWREARLVSGHFVSSPLILLALQESSRRRQWIVLLPDSADADSLRRLRVRLRLESESQGPGNSAHKDTAKDYAGPTSFD